VVKNKVAPPFKIAEFDIFYNEGISHYGDVLNSGIKQGIIKKAGAWLQFENVKLGQGVEASKEFLRGSPETVKKIKELLFAGE